MGDTSKPKDRPSKSKSQVLRSQKIIQLAPSDLRPQVSPEDGEPQRDIHNTLPRNHTPGHISNKSVSGNKLISAKTQRQRSQTVVVKTIPSATRQSNGNDSSPTDNHSSTEGVATRESNDGSRPLALRSTSAIASNRAKTTSGTSTTSRPRASLPQPTTRPYTPYPPLADPKTAPDVLPSPASGIYLTRAPISGCPPKELRAHTTTLINSNIYVFGGCDARNCYSTLYVFDADSMHWSIPHVVGEIPVPLRAMTTTAVGKKLVVFGGGDGPAYYNDVYVLDTVNYRWSKPKVGGVPPSKRRAHTACLYKHGIYVFGGGDGVRALNDVWRLDVQDTNKMSWKLISSPSLSSAEKSPSDGKPKARGYHTANMVGSKLIVYGGSDGGECFKDVWVLDIDPPQTSNTKPTLAWVSVALPNSHPRLSHSSTLIGSYLFIMGGHDGVEYSSDILMLNLVTMAWDTSRNVYGAKMSGRGYHGATLVDGRVIIIGGFDGEKVFGETWILELGGCSYFSQISCFTIDV